MMAKVILCVFAYIIIGYIFIGVLCGITNTIPDTRSGVGDFCMVSCLSLIWPLFIFMILSFYAVCIVFVITRKIIIELNFNER